MLHQQREDGVLLHPAIDLISGVLGIGEFRRGGIHRDDREFDPEACAMLLLPNARHEGNVSIVP
jgi:hypothetical protein